MIRKISWFFQLLFVLFFSPSCKTMLIKAHFNSFKRHQGEDLSGLSAVRADGSCFSPDSLRGRVTFLIFWGSWCPACISDIPYSNKLIADLRRYPDIQFVNIAVKSNVDEWRKTIREKGYQGIHLRIPEDSVADRLDSRLHLSADGYPVYLILDKNGVILGSGISAEEEVLAMYALLQARQGLDVRSAAFKLLRVSGKKNHSDDEEVREYRRFLEDYAAAQQSSTVSDSVLVR